jgi:Ni,Fe-hydrogenase III large subunit
MATSLRLARALLEALPAADDATPVGSGTGAGKREGRATMEGPHGAVTATVTLSGDSTVQRLGLRRPGAALVAALPEVLEGQRLELVPMVLASLDLCMECADL